MAIEFYEGDKKLFCRRTKFFPIQIGNCPASKANMSGEGGQFQIFDSFFSNYFDTYRKSFFFS